MNCNLEQKDQYKKKMNYKIRKILLPSMNKITRSNKKTMIKKKRLEKLEKLEKKENIN